ncbi:hypothetical protein FF2_022746 [Malus domestica]
MRGWGDVGDSEEARKLFDEMTERGCLVDVPAYDSYLEALCKGGKVDEAYKIFREMGSNGVEPDACTYSIFIRTYCEIMIHGLCKKKCKLDEACKYFEIMIDEGIPPYSSTVQMLSNQGIYR